DVPAQKRQGLMERGDPRLKFRIFRGCRQDDANAADPFRLLRPSCGRPRCRRTAEKRDELASSHCPSRAGGWIVAGQTTRLEVVKLALGNVRFGSITDIEVT